MKRWAVFAIAVGIAVATLAAMSWTSPNGKAVILRLPDQKGSKVGRCLVVASQLGVLAAGIEDDYRGGASPPPLLTVVSFRNIMSLPNLRVPYVVILGIECVALFFLVPSVLASRKRESPTD